MHPCAWWRLSAHWRVEAGQSGNNRLLNPTSLCARQRTPPPAPQHPGTLDGAPYTAPDTHSPAVGAAPAGPSRTSPALPGSPSAAHSPWHKGCDTRRGNKQHLQKYLPKEREWFPFHSLFTNNLEHPWVCTGQQPPPAHPGRGGPKLSAPQPGPRCTKISSKWQMQEEDTAAAGRCC